MPDEKTSLSPLPDSQPPPDDNGRAPLLSHAATLASSSSQIQSQTRFAALSMHLEDRLRFFNFPPEAFNICRKVIATEWTLGIQDEWDHAGSVEVKLSGVPWCGRLNIAAEAKKRIYSMQGATGPVNEPVEARRLICAILGALHSQGWVLTLSTDLGKGDWAKDVLLFRHQVPSPVEHDWCCIGFPAGDRITFIDGVYLLHFSFPSNTLTT